MLNRRLVAGLAAAVVGFGLVPVSTLSLPGVAPATAVAAKKSTVIRVATFNVRTARAKDRRNWLTRAPDVAREILDAAPGLVALQELGPGRADGKKGKIGKNIRQTESLVASLARLGGSRYKLVRAYAFVKPGSVNGTQGSRILYDSTRYTLLSYCPETTGKSNWNPSCRISLPIAAGDSEKRRRTATYAKFADKASGQEFWLASAHLDERHGSKAKDAKYSALRARQAAYVADVVARANPSNLPVIFGGDINSWRTDRSRYAPHRALEARGFADSVTAPVRVRDNYTTVNHFKTTLKKTWNVKLDVVMAKGASSFVRWENKAQVIDRARPSDHNMVVAELTF
jgi:endonuclease/exonuclease/phosphatase family metal-dependent hydrolase